MSENVIKFTRGVPPPSSFPTSQLAECTKTVLENHGGVVLQYGAPGGFPPLRALTAAEAGVSENRVAIGQGSLQLFDILCRNLLGPGKLAYVENPTYDRTLSVLGHSGAQVRGFPLEDDGLDVDMVAARLNQGERPELIYIIPDFQNPSGTVLSLEKRQRVVELAERYNFWIVEDIPYRKLRYRGEDVPTFLSLAPQRVVQLSSFSKLIGPGLRVGTAVMPDALAGKILQFIDDTYICPSYFIQAIVYDYAVRGWLAANVASLKALYAPRLEALLSSLQTEMSDLATWYKPDGGFFVGVNLKAEVDADTLLHSAGAAGLALTDGRGFFCDGGGNRFVRLPFSALTPQEIQAGVRRLAGVIRSMAGEKIVD